MVSEFSALKCLFPVSDLICFFFFKSHIFSKNFMGVFIYTFDSLGIVLVQI